MIAMRVAGGFRALKPRIEAAHRNRVAHSGEWEIGSVRVRAAT